MCKFGDPANRLTRKTVSLPSAQLVKERQQEENFIEQNDYGFFEDTDFNDPLLCDRSFSTKCDTEIDGSNGSSSPNTVSLPGSDQSMSVDSLSSESVVCAIEDGSAPLCCRYFSNGDNVYISVDGFRIVKENFCDEAEFKVHLIVNEKEYVAWRKAKDFEAIAQAIFQFSQVYQEDPYAMHNTMCSWGEYVRFLSFHRQNGVPHRLNAVELGAETNLLRTFIMNLLYEIPTTCMILLKFVSPTDSN